MNAVQKHQAIHDAAERIFSHAVDWNEGRKKWDSETVEHIIRHELEKAELANKSSIGKRIYRGLRWVVLQGLVIITLYLALRGNKTAWNLFVFLQWLSTICWALICSARKEKQYFSYLPPQAVPGWIAATSDLLIACALAAFGHFVYASIQIIEMMCEQTFYDARANSQKPKAEAQ